MAQNNPFTDAFKNFESFGKQNQSANLNEAFNLVSKTFETFQEAGKIIADSSQSIAKLQGEIIQANAENALNLFKEVASSKDPRESASKQAAFAKSVLDKASKDAQQITDIATKANKKATDLISSQVAQNISKATDAKSSAANKKPANKAA